MCIRDRIYHQCRYKDAALTHLARWYDEVEKSGFLAFGRVGYGLYCLRHHGLFFCLYYIELNVQLEDFKKIVTGFGRQ